MARLCILGFLKTIEAVESYGEKQEKSIQPSSITVKLADYADTVASIVARYGEFYASG